MPHTNEALLPFGLPVPGRKVVVNAHAMRYAPTLAVWRAGHWLQRAARRMDAWLAVRAKARDDARCLQAMSERELLDIGIHPAHIQPAASARDWTT